ncbi:hypothetical protein LEMLEM_LOCUS27187 [Lemmus lemmus]
MSHTRRSTSSIFTWVKLQSSSSSQARWPRGRCQWRRQWQAGGVAGTALHWASIRKSSPMAALPHGLYTRFHVCQ